jgi:hypothetical protein
MIAAEPRRWVRVDGAASPDEVARQVRAAAEGRGIAAGQGRGVR